MVSCFSTVIFCYMPVLSSFLTRLVCSSCSPSSFTDWSCFCFISFTWASWLRPSSSIIFFSIATSCSLLALSKKEATANIYSTMFHVNGKKVINDHLKATHLNNHRSSCCAAVVSSESSSSVFRADSSSSSSFLAFSDFVQVCRSASSSSWSSETSPSISCIFFRALLFWADSFSMLVNIQMIWLRFTMSSEAMSLNNHVSDNVPCLKLLNFHLASGLLCLEFCYLGLCVL